MITFVIDEKGKGFLKGLSYIGSIIFGVGTHTSTIFNAKKRDKEKS